MLAHAFTPPCTVPQAPCHSRLGMLTLTKSCHGKFQQNLAGFVLVGSRSALAMHESFLQSSARSMLGAEEVDRYPLSRAHRLSLSPLHHSYFIREE